MIRLGYDYKEMIYFILGNTYDIFHGGIKLTKVKGLYVSK